MKIPDPSMILKSLLPCEHYMIIDFFETTKWDYFKKLHNNDPHYESWGTNLFIQYEPGSKIRVLLNVYSLIFFVWSPCESIKVCIIREYVGVIIVVHSVSKTFPVAWPTCGEVHFKYTIWLDYEGGSTFISAFSFIFDIWAFHEAPLGRSK